MLKREIEFKAISKVYNKWVYGYYMKQEGKNYIINDNGVYGVVEATVAQYTGLKDIEGNKIYENDVLISFNGKGYDIYVIIDKGHIRPAIEGLEGDKLHIDFLTETDIEEYKYKVVGNKFGIK